MARTFGRFSGPRERKVLEQTAREAAAFYASDPDVEIHEKAQCEENAEHGRNFRLFGGLFS